MIKAVVFDCFGVLTNDGWLGFKSQYLHDEAARDEAMALNRQADSGYISQGQFEQELARLAGVDEATVQRVVDGHTPNNELFDYIREVLKPRYAIGLLSNVSADYTAELFTADQNALFDAKTFSYELGVVKPHHAMYESIATKLDALPEECVFVDDREAFVTGAKEVGMQAIWYRGNDQLKLDLPALLNV